MFDFPSKNSEDPDALTVNGTSRAVNGTAFLAFVGPKSLAAPIGGSVAENGAMLALASEVANGNPYVHDRTASQFPVKENAQIDIEDWDSLFGAVEERLRDTVLKPDMATKRSAAQDNASRIKSVVLDCVSALDKLHRALQQERRTQVPAKANGAISDTAVALPLTNGHDPCQNN